MTGNGAGQQKKQQIFFRLTAFAGRTGGGWYSVLRGVDQVRSEIDNPVNGKLFSICNYFVCNLL